MQITLGPFITCFLTVLFLTIYVFVTVYVRKNVLYHGMKVVFLLISFILIRMLIPFNFPFTITIASRRLLPPVDRFLFTYLGGTKMDVATVLFGIWFFITAVQILRMILRQRSFRNYLRAFRVKDLKQYPRLYQILQDNDVPDLPVYMVPLNMSPAIVGVFHPVFVLPIQEFTDTDLYYICEHEIRHYKNHDLWLKMFIDLVMCAQWFNPATYFLNKELTLVFELSNDQRILQSCDELQRLEYTECILKVAENQNGKQGFNVGLPFASFAKSDLETRTSYIISGKWKEEKKHRFSVAVHYVLIILVLLASFLLVPEGSSVGEGVEAESFLIDKENSYILKSESDYVLFVDGNYMVSLPYIPEELSDLPVYEEEDMK